MSKTTNKFAPEFRERRVRMAANHERDYPSRWIAVVSIAEKVEALERENRELRQTNGILRKTSAYFAQAEFDRPLRR